jgi:hypothetical protein
MYFICSVNVVNCIQGDNMAKYPTSFRLKNGTLKKLQELAIGETRSMSNMLEVLILRAYAEQAQREVDECGAAMDASATKPEDRREKEQEK